MSLVLPLMLVAATSTTAPVTSSVTEPLIELPLDMPGVTVGLVPGIDEPDILTRGLQDLRLTTPGTVLGSYGQFQATYLSIGRNAPFDGTATLRRLVLFVSHQFTERFQGYVELEWENAIACSNCNGSVEVEQAFVEGRLLEAFELSVRTGMVLIPMGIINQWHEPPVFHGVDRPRFDQTVIPTTWRELGVGVTGTFADLGRFEFYLTTAPDVLNLGPGGLAGALTQGALAPANGFIFSGRAEIEPQLGFVIGTSMVAGDLGGGSRFFDSSGERVGFNFPIFGASLDLRWRDFGVEARAVAAAFFLPAAGDLLQTFRADGSAHFADPVASGVPADRIWGAYGEVAYDVLVHADTEQQLLPFLRLEFYDTQASVPTSFAPDLRFRATEWTFGLSYRPAKQVVFKVDYQLRDRRLGLDEKQFNLGMGYMF